MSIAKVLRHYDVIIAGGGMVGCTLACAFAKNSKLASQKVLLLEGSPEQTFVMKEHHSNRVSALSPSTKKLMCSLGAWEHIENMRLQTVKNMQVWDACSDALITFNQSNFEKAIAYIVENDVLLHAVNTELKSSNNPNLVDVVYNSKITNYSFSDKAKDDYNCTINLSNGEKYTCKLLVGADGANSMVRKAIGAPYVSWNYNQMGVVATLKLTEETNNTTAWQRFLTSGPVALLPLNSSYSSLVWSTSPHEAKSLIKMPEEEFISNLNSALNKQFPKNRVVESATKLLSELLSAALLPSGMSRQIPPSIESVVPSSRAAFPLGFGHSARYVSNGVVLIGDAAHRVHPLAGQGVNLGFGDITCLIDVLADAIYSGACIDDKSYLLKYETKRQRHVVPTAAVIDGLQKLYGTEMFPIVFVRSLGLQLTNAVSPVKKYLMNHAMG